MRRRLLVGVLVLLAVLLAWWLAWPEAAPGVSEGVAAAPKPRPRAVRAARRDPPPRPATEAEPAAAPEIAPTQGPYEVRCRVGDALDGRTPRLFVVSGEATERIGFALVDGEVVFDADQPEGRGILMWAFGRPHADGDTGGQLAWTAAGTPEARCVIDRLPRPLDAAIYGRVRGAERLPDGTVFLEGCGLERRGEAAPVDVDGGFFLQAESGRCALRAWRQAGMLRLPGPWVEVDADAEGDVEVDLDVPTFAPAGMGIGFGVGDDGVVVTQVHDGTPAMEAGLGVGDVITTIDGVDTVGMSTEDFLHQGIGPAGTEVHLEGTTADGEPFDVSFHRREIN